MGAALLIRDDLPPETLRRRARHEPNRRPALRMLAGTVKLLAVGLQGNRIRSL